ncbi:MAG TPA: carboxypeptidase-like regulatory domain-containing protein [Puia sp.]|nr:carboxypeptidase-like regulatory domain-containing protein [Puia sp.]
MRSILFLAVLTLAGYTLPAQQAGNTLSGTVVDSTAGTPLAGVSIFLNNTSHGTVSGARGDFHLDIPGGTYQLVFSAIGYTTQVIDVNGAHLPPPLHLLLRRKATELAAVTVEPYDKHGWAKWGKFFIGNFIGATENAADCKLRNHDVLRFYYSRRTNRLSVTATEPLQIDNNALGYTLTFQLEGFKADFNSKYVLSFGYPYFQPMTPGSAGREKYWAFKRKQAYTGSMLQFMRSLYAGHSITDGFLIEKEVTGPNAEKRRVKAIYRPDFQKPGSFSMDTLHYFWDVLRQPDIITWKVVVPPDSVLTVAPDGSRELFFDTPVIVLFGVRQSAGSELRESGLRLVTPRPIKVEENGNYYPAQEVLSTGYWGGTEKICNLLPLDYGL